MDNFYFLDIPVMLIIKKNEGYCNIVQKSKHLFAL